MSSIPSKRSGTTVPKAFCREAAASTDKVADADALGLAPKLTPAAAAEAEARARS
ncbi:hypothetical protein [Actinomyces bovis]|uniref:hypothetical protein n=1 Tax=Actinomyces bovis TaxID=1658 RepID=UPI001474344E|nr:hypothetical protein [Actinomyces bovis]